MEPDQLLHDVFAAQADAHPEPAGVLAAVHERLDRPHRATAGRTAIVFGAAATVAAVAVTAAVVSNRSGGEHPTTAAGGALTANPRVVTHAPLRHTAHNPVTAPNPGTAGGPRATHPTSTYDYSTIAAGWLPGPGHQVEASNQPGFEQRDYDVQVDGTDMDVIIYLEDGTSLPTRTEAGSNFRDFVLNGHPAREFIGDVATIVAFDLGNGKIAYAGPSVVATTSQVTSARITDIAEHVARDMQFDRHDPIPAGAGSSGLLPVRH